MRARPATGGMRPASSIYWRNAAQADDEHEWSDPSLIEADYDVAVLGGGFAGLATAWRIIEMAPATRIILFDRMSVGHGASGRAGGMLVRHPLLPAWLVPAALPPDLLDVAPATLQRLVDRSLIELGETRASVAASRMVLSARHPLGVKAIRWIDRAAPQFGVVTEPLTGQAIDALCGATSAGGSTHAARTIQPFETVIALARWLTFRGVRIVEGAEVSEFTEHADDVAIALAIGGNRRKVTTRHLVICGNAYAPPSLASLLASFRVHRIHTYALATEPLEPDLISALGGPDMMVGEVGLGLEWRRFHSGRLIYGALDVSGLPATDAADFDPGHLDRLQATFRKRMPMLERAQIACRWGGAYLEAQLERPVVQMLTPRGRIIINTGYGGNGISLALMSGLLVRGLVNPDWDDDDAALVRRAYAATRVTWPGMLRALAMITTA